MTSGHSQKNVERDYHQNCRTNQPRLNKEELTTVTLFYDAYYDFGIFGVVIFSCLLGFVCFLLVEKVKDMRNPIGYLLYGQMSAPTEEINCESPRYELEEPKPGNESFHNCWQYKYMGIFSMDRCRFT